MNRYRRGNKVADISRVVLLILFFSVAALLGGSSRSDAIQIVVLRPLSAIFLIAAILLVSRDALGAVKGPLWALLGLAAIMVLQLVPMPPSLWHALPGRAPIADLDQILGMADTWRPLSMVPTRTINALASLIVPISALLVLASSGLSRRTLFIVLLAAGAADATLGVIQVSTGFGYFYEISNFGSAVGLFANRNHSAVFSAISLLVIARAVTSPELGFGRPSSRVCLGALFALSLVAALISGSRAGLAATILATGVAGFLVYQAWRSSTSKFRNGETPVPARITWGVLAIVAGLAATIGAFFMFDRIPALSRIADAGALADLRWRLLPVLQEMMATYGLTGSGFGSFEEVFHIHTTPDLLEPSYVNQAHNDWAQLIIEGGVPVIVLFIFSCVWAVRSLSQIARQRKRAAETVVFWLAITAVIAFASAVDYPLRAPFFQTYAVILAALFSVERTRASDE